MKTLSPFKQLSLILLTLACGYNGAFGSDVEDVEAMLQNEFDILVETINDKKLSPNAKRALIERQIGNRLSLGQMTIQSLGSQAAYFNFQEFADFSKEFEENLLYFYLARTASFEGGEIEIISTVKDEATGIITSKTLGGKRAKLYRKETSRSPERANIEYQLNQINGEWKIFKIAIEGVDIDSNFKAQLKSSLKRKSPSEITDMLRKSNAKHEKQNPFAK